MQTAKAERSATQLAASIIFALAASSHSGVNPGDQKEAQQDQQDDQRMRRIDEYGKDQYAQ